MSEIREEGIKQEEKLIAGGLQSKIFAVKKNTQKLLKNLAQKK